MKSNLDDIKEKEERDLNIIKKGKKPKKKIIINTLNKCHDIHNINKIDRIVTKNNFIFIIFIIIYYLYFLSLERCLEGEGKCCKKFKWIQKKLNEGLVSAILLLFTFEFMIHNIISKFHLFHIIFAFILFYKYSHGFTFDDHGLYNLLGVISLLIILIISLLLNSVVK